jgi:uncharacterized protein
MSGERDLDQLLTTMEPFREPGDFVFVTLPELSALASLATVVEREGVTHLFRKEDADAFGLKYSFVAAWITLKVHSALDAVGLTAAVSTVLAEHGISCNVLAGFYHDHLLVPSGRVDDAIAALERLSKQATLRAGRPGVETSPSVTQRPARNAQIVDAQIVEAEIVEAEIVEAEIVEAEIVEAEIVEAQIVEAETVEAEIVDAEDT